MGGGISCSGCSHVGLWSYTKRRTYHLWGVCAIDITFLLISAKHGGVVGWVDFACPGYLISWISFPN